MSDIVILPQPQPFAIPASYAVNGAKGDPGSPGEGYATRSAMAARASPALLDDVYLTEAGREGKFVVDLASSWTAAIAADTAQGVFVVSTADATKVYRRVINGLANHAWWGLVADNSTDNHAALQGAIDTLAALKMTTEFGYGFGSVGLRTPAARNAYYCSQKLVVAHTLYWEFDNGAGAAGGAAVIRLPDSQGGILLDTDAITGGAAGSVLVRPMLFGGFSTTEGNYHGIEFRVPCEIVDPKVFNFPGEGIYLETHATGYKANGAVIRNPFCQSNRNGIYLGGEDANAILLDNPTVILNRRYGIWKKLTLGGAIIGGDTTGNGTGAAVGGGIPYTLCAKQGGDTVWRRYYLLPAGNGANAPSGTTAATADWAYLQDGVSSVDIPVWSNSLSFRSGGGGRYEGSYEQTVIASHYLEPDQAPIQIEDTAQTLILSSISGTPVTFDGTPYGGTIWGDGSRVRVLRAFKVGDTETNPPSVPNSLSHADVQGDLSLTRATGNAYDPILHINTTSATGFATIQFEHNTTNGLQLQYYTDVGSGGFYAILASAGHAHNFYVGGANIAKIASTGLQVISGSLGYGTGVGGTVTQATSKATGVTLNKVSGQITLNNAALAANTVVTFTLTNSTIAADDDVRVWVKSGNASAGSYRVAAEGNGAGSRTIVVENKTGGSLSEALVLGFNTLKAVTA